jgi:uncharacterized membrane protein
VLESLEQGGLLAYLLVFVAAATPVLEIVLVIPAGIAAGLSPVAVTAVALTGNVATVVVVIFAGDRVLHVFRRRRSSGRGTAGKPSKRSERAQRVVQRWGVPGLALLAPVSTGTHIAAVAALSLGAPRRNVLWWMIAGLGVWAVGVAAAAVLGLGLLDSLT